MGLGFRDLSSRVAGLAQGAWDVAVLYEDSSTDDEGVDGRSLYWSLPAPSRPCYRAVLRALRRARNRVACIASLTARGLEVLDGDEPRASPCDSRRHPETTPAPAAALGRPASLLGGELDANLPLVAVTPAVMASLDELLVQTEPGALSAASLLLSHPCCSKNAAHTDDRRI